MIEDTYMDHDPSKSGTKQQDRYLVNYEKRIVMKKVEGFELLRGLKIKVNTGGNNGQRVHFVDVFRALVKRVFKD
jgi:hypothetical protein